MRGSLRRGALAIAGALAGAAVGLADGFRVGVLVDAGPRGLASAMLLCAGVDALIGAAAGAVAELLARLAVWGRRGHTTGPVLAAALLAAGGLAGVAALAAVVATADRRDRFLAAGVVVLVDVAAALVAALLAPALARLVSPRRLGRPLPRLPDPALVVLAPLALLAVNLVVFLAVARARAPLVPPRLTSIAALVAVEAALLPGLLVWAESLPIRLPARWAAVTAGVAFVAPLFSMLAFNWSRHLRFLPWTQVLVAASLAVATLVALSYVSRPVNQRLEAPLRRAGVLAGAVAFAAILALAAAESEPARKAAARAGLVGPVLAWARQALDFDGDGHPRLLGGGDCDDRNPTVHPGALDTADDGLDDDCDGQDTTVAVLRPPPFVGVPASVPADLSFLLITIDTLRADHLGCYGYGRATSPVIDRLAAEGALFENGWAHAPSTRYSMPALASARWPSAIAWDESIWWPRMAPEVRTVGQAMKAAGYLTAAFYSYEYFAPQDRRGFERGIDVYRADRAALHRAVNGPMESRGSSSREIADDTIAFLESHKAEKFFAWVHFYDPHLSYEPHPEVPSFGRLRLDLYDGEIRFTDLHLGRVIDRLRALGMWERTAVIVTGDHGEGFGEHGITEHGFHLYPAQTKVPLVVRVPGLQARRIAAPAGHVDIGPTMLNLARAAQEPAFLGRSLVSELAGLPGVAPPLFQEVSSERGKKRALVTEDLHVIWNWTPENTTECYNRRADPQEQHDLWGSRRPRACEELKRRLTGMVSALAAPPGAAEELSRSVFPPGSAAPAPPVVLEASIGDALTLQGFGISSVSVAPGGEVEVAHHFAVRAPLPRGWRLFFHLRGPGGSFRNLDHVPVRGAFPLERWRPGQRIVDRFRIAIPPGTAPGRYQVALGVYRGGSRLAVTPRALSNGDDAVATAAIEVR
jgi:choline-sulfatase